MHCVISTKEKQDKEKSIEYQIWNARISEAKAERDVLAQEGDEHRDAYNGKGAARVNLVYPDVKQSVAANYSKNPKVFFEPENPQSEKAATIFEALNTHLMEKLKFKKLMRGVIRSAKFDPVVATKTFYRYSSKVSKTVFNDTVHNDEVYTELVLCKYLLKDKSAPTYEKSSWIGHIDRDSAYNLQERFGLSDDDLLKIAHNSDTPELKNTSGKDRYKYIYSDYYEIEDRVAGKIFYIIEGIDRILGEKEKRYKFDSMYDFFEPNYVEGSEERHSDLYYWRNQRADYNRMRRIINDSADKSAPKTILKGNWSENEISQLKDGTIRGIIHVKDQTKSIESLQHSQVDPIVSRNLGVIQGEAQLIAKNVIPSPSNDKTATEIKANEMAAQEIESEYRELLEEMMASIAFKWMSLAQQHYTTKRVIRLTGYSDAEYLGFKNDLGDIYKEDGKKKFLEFDKSKLEGDVTVTIEAGSTLPDNEQARFNSFNGFAGFISKVPEARAEIDMARLIEEAQDVYKVRNQGLIKSKNSPYEENKLLVSGMWVSPQMSDDDAYHLSVHMAEGTDSPEKELHMYVHQKQLEIKQASMMNSMPTGGAQGDFSPQTSPTGAEGLQNLSPLPAQSGDAINQEAEAMPPMQQ